MSTKFQYILDFVANNKQLINAVNQSEKKVSELGVKAAGTQNKLGSMMDGAGNKLAAMASFAAITAGATALVTNIIDVRKEFEKYEAVLTITLGSSQKARQEMQMLQQFAAETPFALTELTGAFVKLTNYGLKPSQEEMRKYGDLASSVGKGFDQLAEAVADSVTGEFERLKEFGIKAKAEGDKISFTFKGQTDIVKNNAEAIKEYIVGLGDLKGVTGSMAAIAATLGGKISNLGDSWDGLMNTFGKGTSGIMVGVIEMITSYVGTLDMAFKSIEQIKQAVNDTSISGSVTNAMNEIAVMKKGLMGNGMSDIEAQKKALELYYNSINQRIAETNKSRKEGAYELKQALIDERNGVAEQVKTLDVEAKKRDEATNKTKTHALSVGALGEEITRLNVIMAGTNANDLTSIQIIGAKIEALKKQKEAVENIASDPISFRTDSFGTLPTAQVTGKLTVKNDDKGLNLKPKLDVKDFTGNADRIAAANKAMRDELDATKKKVEAVQSAFQEGFNNIGQSVLNGLGLAETGFQGFLGGLASTVIQLLSMFMAQAMAASIAGASVSGAATGPAAIFTTPAFIATAIAGVLGAFAAIPAFAEGGIVSGPTMGLMGEYPGASSNPEVIAPLSKLKGMIGSGGGTTVILQPSIEYSGDRMRILLNRVEGNLRKRT